MLHFKNVCQYGIVHSQCRCPGGTEHKINCPSPDVCARSTGNNPPKHRKDITPRDVLLSPEQAVHQWEAEDGYSTAILPMFNDTTVLEL